MRLARASTLGALSLLLATSAHLIGGGMLPTVGVLFLSGSLLGLGAAVVTRWRCRFSWLAPLLMVQQVLLHELFRVAAATGQCGTPPTGSMVHDTVHANGVAICAEAADMGMEMGGPAGAMWAAHLLATATTAWLLACGEAWLWRVVDRIGAAAALGRAPGVAASRRRHGATPFTVVLHRSVQSAPAGPRGPPELATC